MGPVIAAASVVLVAAAIAGWVASANDGDEADAPPRGVIVGRACTLIGCSSGASVAVKHLERSYPDARRLLFCVESYCRSERIERDKRFNGASIPTDFGRVKEESVKVELILLGAHARTLHRVLYEGRPKAEYPNGRHCDKGCRRLDLYYDAANDVLARPPDRRRP